MLLTRVPRPSLRPFVKVLWATKPTTESHIVTSAREHVLPTGSMHLVFRLSGPPLRLFAVEAGATVEIPPQDQFYGERSGSIRDPFGHRRNIGHSIEEVSPAEMQRRYSEMLKRS